MKEYEVEVLSVPAGKSMKFITKNFIYECPDTDGFRYKLPLYMAFRYSQETAPPGINSGEMDTLYKLEKVISLNPRNEKDLEDFKASANYEEDHKKRILGYINDIRIENLANETKRFYVLSTRENLPLKHRPKPKTPGTFKAIYSLYDMLIGEKIVKPVKKS